MLVKFEFYSDGSCWCARVIGVDIFTQGKTMDELMRNVREAVELHFEEELDRGEQIELQPMRSLDTLFGALPDLDLRQIHKDHQKDVSMEHF
jgi:hypothetical protein